MSDPLAPVSPSVILPRPEVLKRWARFGWSSHAFRIYFGPVLSKAEARRASALLDFKMQGIDRPRDRLLN